jgi:DegV family protein with EDD domain
MARVRIVTDSTADLPASTVEQLGITVMPLTIHIGQKNLRDGVDLSREEFFKRLARMTTPPTTAPVTRKQFDTLFTELTKNGDAVVAILSSSKLGDTFQNATRAAAPLLGRSKIVVIDSQLMTVGLGMLVVAAAQAAHRGDSLDDVVKLVRGMIPHIYIGFFVETLDYLERGGRIGSAQALLGTMLNIKPLLILEDGEVVALEKVRTRAKAIEKLVEFITEFARIERMIILHSNTPEDVNLLIEQINLVVPNLDISVDHYGPIAATHVGPSALGVVVYEGM